MILVVDDSRIIRSLVVAALVQVNVGVREADCGVAALRVCAQERIDLVLLDIELPDENGVAICARLKSTARTAQIPIILMSGHSEESLGEINEGIANYFLHKPFTLHEIQQMVQHVLVQVSLLSKP